MAPKRPDPKDEPPAASSWLEEEETTSGAEEEETSEDEEEEIQTTMTQKSAPIKKPEIASPPSAATTAANIGNQSSESDESGSDESGSETDSDSMVPSVKPIATKPMEENTKSKQSGGKPAASAAKSSAKRPAEPKPVQKETKRAKKDSENGEEEGKKAGDDVKKQLFQRIWSQEDEIAILKGMIDYSAKKGADPNTDMNAFYGFVKDSLQFDCTKAQLSEKVRRLKKKYVTNVKKGKEDGFAKPHEQEAYKLSKKIWGHENKELVKAETPVKSKSNVKPKKNQSLPAVKVELLPSLVGSKENKPDDILPDLRLGVASIVPDLRLGVANIEEEVLSYGLDVAVGENKAALQERWRKLRIAELELFLQRKKLVADQAKFLLDYYKSANN